MSNEQPAFVGEYAPVALFTNLSIIEKYERKKYVSGNFNHVGIGDFCVLWYFIYHCPAIDHDVRFARGKKGPSSCTASGRFNHDHGRHGLAIDKN